MATSSRQRRTRGAVDRLPSGAYRVRVYAGADPVTGKRHSPTELVPPGPRAAAEAEKVRTRLLSQLDERRNPRTRATLNQLLDRYVEVLDVDDSTRKTYVGYIDNRIRPTLGRLQVGRLDGEVLDSFYAELRRCRGGCPGRRRGVDHRTKREHDCDDRCRPHVCRPLAASHGPADPLDPVRSAGTSRPLALDRGEPGDVGRTAVTAAAKPAAALGGGRGQDPHRGLEGFRVGSLSLARHDRRRPPR